MLKCALFTKQSIMTATLLMLSCVNMSQRLPQQSNPGSNEVSSRTYLAKCFSTELKYFVGGRADIRLKSLYICIYLSYLIGEITNSLPHLPLKGHTVESGRSEGCQHQPLRHVCHPVSQSEQYWRCITAGQRMHLGVTQHQIHAVWWQHRGLAG